MNSEVNMKIAIIGSRNITREDVGDISKYLPQGLNEIVSGGALGVDRIAAEYAHEHGIKLTEFLPEYNKYKRGAPLKRNELIADYADEAIALWDGSSTGTKHAIDLFLARGKNVGVIILPSKK